MQHCSHQATLQHWFQNLIHMDILMMDILLEHYAALETLPPLSFRPLPALVWIPVMPRITPCVSTTVPAVCLVFAKTTCFISVEYMLYGMPINTWQVTSESFSSDGHYGNENAWCNKVLQLRCSSRLNKAWEPMQLCKGACESLFWLLCRYMPYLVMTCRVEATDTKSEANSGLLVETIIRYAKQSVL